MAVPGRAQIWSVKMVPGIVNFELFQLLEFKSLETEKELQMSKSGFKRVINKTAQQLGRGSKLWRP